MAKKKTKSKYPPDAVTDAEAGMNLVNGVVDKAIALMNAEFVKVHHGQRWLFLSRAVNQLFQRHYRITFYSADEIQMKRELEAALKKKTDSEA